MNHSSYMNPFIYTPETLNVRFAQKNKVPETWNPWIDEQQKSYQPPDWGLFSNPSSTRGHESSVQSLPTINTNQNPLLNYQRPLDSREKVESKNSDITNIWKRAEISGTYKPNIQISQNYGMSTR